ncbi:hypothetical protein CF327_g7177 [Tilletia walkeri]|nr:hypothetical protein CF327_g7177 [Tilletia walkeri]
MATKRKKTTQAPQTAKRAPPRCRKGCKDSAHPTLGALKADCACSQRQIPNPAELATTPDHLLPSAFTSPVEYRRRCVSLY